MSEQVYQLKKAAELYDERGFQQGKSITVDGKLVVSNSNGNVSYSYPISESQVGGYPLKVVLNYCGSVSFTTFDRNTLAIEPVYYEGEGEGGHLIEGAPYIGWKQFRQNRPAWIIGVNGFAVQMLNVASHFHCDRATMNNRTKQSWHDDDFVWVADGYDFCNRMVAFQDMGDDEYKDYARDVIRLLREDGSILELINIQRVFDTTFVALDSNFYTGYYYVNEANASGFAMVESASDLVPDYISPSLITAENTPRRCRYFPGDGLEYVFEERIAPYGTNVFRNNDTGWNNQEYGGYLSGPTIFYLAQIRSGTRSICDLTRSRHYANNNYDHLGSLPITIYKQDSTLGRALLVGFGDHSFEYGGNWMVIQALGRTTKIRFDSIVTQGAATDTVEMPLASFGYMGTVPQVVASLSDDVVPYQSYQGLVTEIVDPEGRKTRFAY